MSLESKLENLRHGAEDLANDINESEAKLDAYNMGKRALDEAIESEVRYRDKLMDLLEAVQARQEFLTPKQEELFPEFDS